MARERSTSDIPLGALPLLAVDCQTTGPAPATSRLLEIAWVRLPMTAQPGPPPSDGVSFVLAQPPDEPVATAILRLTGISQEDITGGADPKAVSRALREAMESLPPVPGGPFLLAHYARFERPCVESLLDLTGTAMRPVFICTWEIARRVLPELPRRGLRAISGYFGHGIHDLKRALPNALATVTVWYGLLDLLDSERGITGLRGLLELLQEPPPARTRNWDIPMPREDRLAIPDGPGVYRFLGASGQVLYVGKATSLRSRVNSYFRTKRADEKVLELVTQTRLIETTPTETALEAALLELELIRSLNPPYNTLLRDRGREVWHYSPDLGRCSCEGATGFPVGPLPSSDCLAPMLMVRELLDRGAADEKHRDLFCSVMAIEPSRLDADTLEEALDRFRIARLDGLAGTPSITSMLRAGAAIWIEKLAEREEARQVEEGKGAEGCEPASVAVAEPPLSADQATRYLEGAVSHCAHLVRRSRWFRLLSDSLLLWTPGGVTSRSRRCLVLRGGQVIRCDALRHAGEPEDGGPGPGGARRIPDRAAYERLRLVTTELRRLVSTDGAAPEVHLPTERVLSAERLERLLRMQ
ncbi:GIY-YIG nuclease family protein [Candidatus Fermentibacterales bacterium]|nr:GIY-YIG nuclease family protein [Candidatus Fermentibacterales bacterium]